MHETMGLSGTDCLWILGNPYNLGGGGGGLGSTRLKSIAS